MRAIDAGPPGAPRPGFGLIEAVVALAILGLALGALLPVISGQLRQAADARDQRIALLLAESKLAELMLPVNLVAGTTGGQLPGGFDWRAEMAPLGDGGRLVPWRVSIAVAPAGGGRPVRLATVALLATP